MLTNNFIVKCCPILRDPNQNNIWIICSHNENTVLVTHAHSFTTICINIYSVFSANNLHIFLIVQFYNRVCFTWGNLSYQRHTVTSKDKVRLSLAFVGCFVLWNGFCRLNLGKGGCRVTGCCHIATVWVGRSLPHTQKQWCLSQKPIIESEAIFQSVSYTKKLCYEWLYEQNIFTDLQWSVYEKCVQIEGQTMSEECYHNFDRYFCRPHALTSLCLTWSVCGNAKWILTIHILYIILYLRTLFPQHCLYMKFKLIMILYN